MKHLLKLLDLTGEEILDILNLADQLKYETKHGIEHPALKGKCLGMIFEKSSTRTRVSFEVGINQLGGYAVVLGAEGSQIGRGEPVQDTARVLSRYVDGIMIRTFGQDEVEALAQYGSVPVINGLTDFCHPCQVLADLMTIREVKGSLEGLKLCFIGDGNNMMNSLIVGGLKTGMEVAVACPEGYRPPQEILEFAVGVRGEVHPHRRPQDRRERRRRGHHRRVDLHGPGGGAQGQGGCLPGLLRGRGPDGGGQARRHGAALPARPSGGGDQRRRVRGKRQLHLRGGGEPPPRPESRAGKNHGRRPGTVNKKTALPPPGRAVFA